MSLPIENKATIKAPGKTEDIIRNTLGIVPREHLRGLTRVVLVDKIEPDARFAAAGLTSDLPGLYHPKQPGTQPWFEIALGALLPKDGFFKRLSARMTYKANLAGLLLSLLAQHYHLTFSHGLKKNQYEGAIRSYLDKYHQVWRERNAGWRGKLFKPIQPYLDKWARSLSKKYKAEQQKQKS